MPKVVDPQERRTRVFDALFAVIVVHGVHGASLRRVADAANLAIGSVRHYFDSHEAMLRGAAQETIDRITARVVGHRDGLAETTDRSAVFERMVGELMPWTEPSKLETTVWLEFAVAARIDPAFREISDVLHVGVRQLVRIFFRETGLVPDHAVDVEVERFAALIDGLGFGGTLHPDRLPPELAEAVIRQHLDSLRAH